MRVMYVVYRSSDRFWDSARNEDSVAVAPDLSCCPVDILDTPSTASAVFSSIRMASGIAPGLNCTPITCAWIAEGFSKMSPGRYFFSFSPNDPPEMIGTGKAADQDPPHMMLKPSLYAC